MSERAPGFENYTPSRLEWLAFVLNSLSPYLDTPFGEKFKRVYTPKDDGKTLILMVNYPKDSDLEKVETYIEHVTKYVKKYASIYKWDSWLEIEVLHDPE
jgi:hypothetical protein